MPAPAVLYQPLSAMCGTGSASVCRTDTGRASATHWLTTPFCSRAGHFPWSSAFVDGNVGEYGFCDTVTLVVCLGEYGFDPDFELDRH